MDVRGGRSVYYTHITFNDGCMVGLMELLRDTTTDEDFSFLGDNRLATASKAVDRGLDCIVKCQVVIDGTHTVWCAQHDEKTLAPADARTYELASLSGAESAGILEHLMTIERPSPEVMRAVKAGVRWFESVKIEGFRYVKNEKGRTLEKDPNGATLWARFYELETNRPFFCDRDGIPKYSINEIGKERRNGYAWYGTWGESLLKSYAKWPHR